MAKLTKTKPDDSGKTAKTDAAAKPTWKFYMDRDGTLTRRSETSVWQIMVPSGKWIVYPDVDPTEIHVIDEKKAQETAEEIGGELYADAEPYREGGADEPEPAAAPPEAASAAASDRR